PTNAAGSANLHPTPVVTGGQHMDRFLIPRRRHHDDGGGDTFVAVPAPVRLRPECDPLPLPLPLRSHSRPPFPHSRQPASHRPPRPLASPTCLLPPPSAPFPPLTRSSIPPSAFAFAFAPACALICWRGPDGDGGCESGRPSKASSRAGTGRVAGLLAVVGGSPGSRRHKLCLFLTSPPRRDGTRNWWWVHASSFSAASAPAGAPRVRLLGRAREGPAGLLL
uniref:Uncharacterized protein n=1 Tax=Aegilops tauschii subsp. strangulata TaxID=200361 RepID=A0A453QUX1_AEGTS